MKNSSDDAKRLKVNPSSSNSNIKKRTDRLYPVLSDLESIESDNGNCTTATMSTPSIDDDHHHDKYHEDEDINTSDESDDDERWGKFISCLLFFLCVE